MGALALTLSRTVKAALLDTSGPHTPWTDGRTVTTGFMSLRTVAVVPSRSSLATSRMCLAGLFFTSTCLPVPSTAEGAMPEVSLCRVRFCAPPPNHVRALTVLSDERRRLSLLAHDLDA